MITPADTPDQLTEPARPTHAAPTAPLVLVLHGGRGDLARRLVIPSLATLQHRGLLPAHWALLGTGRDVISTQEYQDIVRDSLTEFGQEGTGDADVAALTQHSAFIGDVGEDDPGELPAAIEKTRGALADAAGTDPANVVVVHYLAVPPRAFEPLTKALAAHGLTRGNDGRADTVRVVYEKPYGTSPETFRELDAVVHDALEEQQVFRIDHFLGKEATQNLHVLRFANELFGAVWNHHHVAQVQIDVPETLDVGQRAEFYDGTGAALDMMVSHLFQVAAEVAMEPPRHLAASHLARAREDTLACFRELDVAHDVVLGQFEGYRELESVAEGSTTDTFIAARLWIDNHRWRGVPFLLRTGKRMAASALVVDPQPGGDERVGRRALGNTLELPVSLELPEHDVVRDVQLPEAGERILARPRQMARRQVPRRLHRHLRRDLEQVRHHHVESSTRAVVELRALPDVQRLRHVDLHLRHVVVVPDGPEQFVGEPQHVQVLGGLLAEEVVDPEDLLLLQRVVHDGVQLPERLG